MESSTTADEETTFMIETRSTRKRKNTNSLLQTELPWQSTCSNCLGTVESGNQKRIKALNGNIIVKMRGNKTEMALH